MELEKMLVEFHEKHFKVLVLAQQTLLLETMDLSFIWPSSSGFSDQYAACLPAQHKAWCLNGAFV